MAPVDYSVHRGHSLLMSAFQSVTIAAGQLLAPSSNATYTGGIFGGFSLYNTSATQGIAVEFWDNPGAASGNMIGACYLNANGSANCSQTQDYVVKFFHGIWVVFTGSGTPKGSVRYA